MLGQSSLLPFERKTIRTADATRNIQTANGVIEVRKEANVFVEDLNIWIWAMLVVDSPAVISLGVLCQEHGFSYVWESGQQPRLIKGPKVIHCETDNFVPVVTLSVDQAAPAEDIEAVPTADGGPHARLIKRDCRRRSNPSGRRQSRPTF